MESGCFLCFEMPFLFWKIPGFSSAIRDTAPINTIAARV